MVRIEIQFLNSILGFYLCDCSFLYLICDYIMTVLGVEEERYDSVRYLASLSINTYPNDKLKPIIEKWGDDWVKLKTKKSDWPKTNSIYL